MAKLSNLALATLALLISGSLAEQAPVVGILFLPFTTRTRLKGSYMMVSYAKWMEQMRMKWIPLFMDDPEDVWREKLRKVNGVLLTGGGAPIIDESTAETLLFDKETGGWSKYGKFVYKTVHEIMKINDEGTYKPIWGTCLGFESLMLVLTDASIKFENQLENLVVTLPVNFFANTGQLLSSVFSDADFEKIRTQPTFYHNHHCGFMWENVEKHEWIQKNLNLYATTMTVTGHKVLACFEHKKYPFFAIQFHPEATQFVQRDIYPSPQEGFEMVATRDFAKVFRNLMKSTPSPLTDDEILNYRKDVVHSWGDSMGEMYMNRQIEFSAAEASLV